MINTERSTRRMFFPAALLLLAVSSVAHSGECPKEHRGFNALADAPNSSSLVKVKELSSIDLGREAIGLDNRRLRTRTITVKTGGHVLLHSHEDRPALAMVTTGELFEYVNTCKVPVLHKKGDIIQEYLGIKHWVKNDGKSDVILTVSDIVNDAGSMTGKFK